MTDERGQLGGIEGVAFGLLVFVVGTLIVVNVWAVIDAKLAAASAAREAARAYAEARDGDRADADAASAAAQAIHGYRRDPDRMDVRHESAPFSRCQRVTFTVTYRVSLGAIPIIDRAAATFTAVARHSELVDPYRSGVPGEARCVD